MDSDVKDIFDMEKEPGSSRAAALLIKDAKDAIGGVKVRTVSVFDVCVNFQRATGAKEDEEN